MDKLLLALHGYLIDRVLTLNDHPPHEKAHDVQLLHPLVALGTLGSNHYFAHVESPVACVDPNPSVVETAFLVFASAFEVDSSP